MHILLTVLHTFLMEPVRRICKDNLELVNILSDHFLYSRHLNVATRSDKVKIYFIIFITIRA